jgi:flagellar assembly factor FliW
VSGFERQLVVMPPGIFNIREPSGLVCGVHFAGMGDLMPISRTKFHGDIQYEPNQVLRISDGLFGFPEEKEFLLLELPSSRPLVFIQSVHSQNLCFLSLPVQIVHPTYELALRTEDLLALGYPEGARPVMGKDLLCLAILIVGDRRATTANLAAPLVVDIAAHRGIQAIVAAAYSPCHLLSPQEVLASC